MIFEKLWMIPNNIVGIMFMELAGGRDNWMEVGEREYMAKKGSKSNFILRKKLEIRAITLGQYIFYAYDCFDPATRAHELEHVKQAKGYGPLWFPVYGVASLFSKLRKDNWYWNNRFEEEARKEEEKVKETV